MAKFYKSKFTAAQQDALLDIVEQGGSGGSGGSSLEYLDVSGVDSQTRAVLLSLAIEIKFSFSGGNIVGPILLAMDGIAPLNTLHERVTQMKIDKNSQFNVAGQSGTFMDFLNMMGVSNEQLAAIPRITKEEFYTL